jgi:glutamyl-tRNA reductase
MVEQNVEERRREIARVEEIVGEEVDEFVTYFRSLKAVPLIRGLRQSFDDTRQRELDALFSRSSMSAEEKKRFESFSYNLMQKLLHAPTANIKAMAMQEDSDVALDAVQQLFDLSVSCPAGGAAALLAAERDGHPSAASRDSDPGDSKPTDS